jgi:hypothetical protein
MKTIITILFLTSMAANAQVACGLMPLRPVGSCANMQPVCLCNGVGSCHWQWACQSPQPAQPNVGGFDTRVAPPAALELRPIPYPDVDPLDSAIKLQQLRAMKQEQELKAQQIRALQVQTQQQATPNPLPVSSAPPSEGNVRLSEIQMQAIVSLLERIAVATETQA